MRLATVLMAATLGFGVLGCGGGKAELRPEPVEFKATVKLPAGASAKDLGVTFQPQQNSLPGGGKLAEDGSITTKLTPGKYIVVFSDGNSSHPSYKSIPESYRTPNEANSITVDGQPITIVVK